MNGKQNAKRWGLVTFCVGITCGMVGHYLPPIIAHMAFVFIAIMLALVGVMSIEMDEADK